MSTTTAMPILFLSNPIPLPASIMIYLSNGDGTFSAPISVVQGDLQDFAIGDFNQDGNLDLVVTSVTIKGEGLVNIYLGTGQGSFSSGQGFFFVIDQEGGVAVGDFQQRRTPRYCSAGEQFKSPHDSDQYGHVFYHHHHDGGPLHYDTTNPGFAPDILTGIVAGDFKRRWKDGPALIRTPAATQALRREPGIILPSDQQQAADLRRHWRTLNPRGAGPHTYAGY